MTIQNILKTMKEFVITLEVQSQQNTTDQGKGAFVMVHLVHSLRISTWNLNQEIGFSQTPVIYS